MSMSSTDDAYRHGRRRLGEWITENETAIADFGISIVRDALDAASSGLPRSSVVARLRTCIFEDPVRRMNFSRAMRQAQDAGNELGFRDLEELAIAIDYLVTTAPAFDDKSLIVCPMNAMFDWLMCAPAGYALFRDPVVNDCLRDILSYWCVFLGGPDSRTWLTQEAPGGWLSPAAQTRLHLDQFELDLTLPHAGCISWNDFFTRRFKPGARPAAAPDDDRVIVNACESTPYHVRHNVEFRDVFWIKSQPYSLIDMLTPKLAVLANELAGGSVYQAYLSAYDYHRWHAPISGTVVEAYNVPGTYFSEVEIEGRDQAGLNDSQGYLSATATRAVIAIQSDRPALGTVVCVFIGMGDVSSCIIEAAAGQPIRKGDELGYFQYGGSTWCLLTAPGAVANPSDLDRLIGRGSPLPVCSMLAEAP